jgi:NDP-sugar pyrophosphorylase family protein
MSRFPTTLVLAAGLGTRLRPLSDLVAKPAVPVAGEPLIARVLAWLAAAGAGDVIVNLHHRPESITAIVGDGSRFGLRVRYSWENPVLGSGGGIRRAFALVDDDELLVVNGDTLTVIDPAGLIAAHRAEPALATMALVENPDPRRYGGVRLDGTVVTGFSRRGEEPSAAHFVGVQVVQREAFASVADGAVAESVLQLYPALIARQRGLVRGWLTRGTFHDVGTPWTYLTTSRALAAGDASRLVDASAGISPGARVEETIVWPRARIEAHAELLECIVADGVVVPPGTRYHRAVLVQRGRVPLDGLAAHDDDGLSVVAMDAGR